MAFWDWFRRSSAGIPAAGYIPPLGATPSSAGVAVNQATAMCVSAVYGCVSIRSEDVARCTPGLFREDDKGERTRVTDHPVAKLFKRPNRVQTWFEFCEQMQVALMLRSNAYAAILRDRSGTPVELVPINPDAVMVMEAGDGSIFYNVNRFGLFMMAVLNEFPISIPAEDVMHLRGMSFNMLVAAGRISLAKDSIGVSMGLEQQAARWMANGSRPSGVLTAKTKLTTEAAARLKLQWNNLVQGASNTGNTAVLEEGMDWKQLSLDAGTLEFMEQRNYQIEDIARFYRMPPHKLGRLERTASNGLAQQNQDYVSNTIVPDLTRWEQKIERTFDLDEEGLIVDFDDTQLLRADIVTRYNAHRIGVLSGFEMPSEARRAEGLPFVEGSDMLLVPSNTAALGSDATGTSADGAGKPGAGDAPETGVGTGGNQPGADDVAPQADALVPVVKKKGSLALVR